MPTEARQALRNHGIEVIGELLPEDYRNLVEISAVSNREGGTFITSTALPNRLPLKWARAGGGIAGSATFRYLAEAGFAPILINMDRGSSWRNIALAVSLFTACACGYCQTQPRDFQDLPPEEYRLQAYQIYKFCT